MEVTPEPRLLKLPPGAVENIRKIYNLDKPGRLEEAINILEEWIQKQDHIINKDFSKSYLETTLISCKGSVEKTKKQIDRLCTMKTMVPKFFTITNVKEELDSIMDMAKLFPLPKLTKDYYRVIFVIINTENLTSEMFMQYFQYSIALCEYIKANDYCDGFITINDYRHLNLFDVISKLNTTELQHFMTILTEGYCAKLKAMYLLTDSKAIELLLKTIKPFLSEKIANRIIVVRSLDDLHASVPKEMLPVEYGGNELSVAKLYEETLDELSSEKHVAYLKNTNKACTDETKRHTGKFNDEYMGMPGSFRNLSVD